MKKGVAMKWSEGDKWSATLQIPVGQQVKFKLVKVGSTTSDWEDGNDRELTALGPDFGLVAVCKWNETKSTLIQSYKINEASSAEGHVHPQSFHPPESSPSSSMSSFDEVSGLRGGAGSTWVGAKPEFVKSKKESSRKERRWKVEGLNDGSAIKIVKGDEKAAK